MAEWKVEDHTRPGKYYSTDLTITLEDGRTVEVELSSSDPEPSHVELRDWPSRAIFDEECCDGHYEREATRLVADALAGSKAS